jgi:hypothetical protein
MSRHLPAALVALALLPCGFARAASPYDDLLRVVPPQTNTLVLVNVTAAYASPLAKAEKWAEDYHQRYRSGVGFVPPDAKAVVIASEVNLTTMTRDHQLGLVRVTGYPTMSGLAAREGGSTDTIAGREAALSPRNVYYTDVSGPAVAAVYPADRQATARWIRYATAAKEPQLAPYLKQAADAAGDSVLTVAVDLSDSVDPYVLRLALTASPTLVKHKGLDLGRLARFVASVRGLTFTAKIADAITGTVRVDFADDPTPFRKVLRDLFLELLAEQGVIVPGMDRWEAAFDLKSMTLAGPMTTADLRRVLSLFAFPGAAGEEAPKFTPGEVSAAATKRYLTAADGILADLRKMREGPDYTKTATWHEKAAAQLDHLSRVAVDPVAVAAVDGTARALRAIGASLRGVPIRVEEIGSKAYYYSQPNVGFGISWWGGIRPAWVGPNSVSTNYPQVRAEAAKVIAEDQLKRTQAWSQIDNALAEARRKLTDKYKTPF